MYIPSTQIALLKKILEDFEIAIDLDEEILACLYTFIFDYRDSSLSFEDPSLIDTALALKEIADMEQLTSLEGIIDFFKGEDRAIDDFAADIQSEVEQLLEKVNREEEEENYTCSDDFFLATTSVAIRPALSRFVIGPSKSKNEQFQEVFKEQSEALQKMIIYRLTASGIDQYYYYMEDILQQAILNTLLTFKDSASLPSNVKNLLFEKAREAVDQVCKYEERKSGVSIEELENKLIADESIADLSEKLWLLSHFIEELPRSKRNILILRMQGLSVKEIAQLTGRKLNSTHSILHKAYGDLRSKYRRVYYSL